MYSTVHASFLLLCRRIEKCLGDIEIILKEDFASEGPKHDFLQWRLQYDAAVIEIESSDMTSALRSIVSPTLFTVGTVRRIYLLPNSPDQITLQFTGDQARRSIPSFKQ